MTRIMPAAVNSDLENIAKGSLEKLHKTHRSVGNLTVVGVDQNVLGHPHMVVSSMQ